MARKKVRHTWYVFPLSEQAHTILRDNAHPDTLTFSDGIVCIDGESRPLCEISRDFFARLLDDMGKGVIPHIFTFYVLKEGERKAREWHFPNRQTLSLFIASLRAKKVA